VTDTTQTNSQKSFKYPMEKVQGGPKSRDKNAKPLFCILWNTKL